MRLKICVFALAIALPICGYGENSRSFLIANSEKVLAPAIYIVNSGDSLWTIFHSFKRNQRWRTKEWNAFLAANPQIDDPASIRPGNEIYIPSHLLRHRLNAVEMAARSMPKSTDTPLPSSYVVASIFPPVPMRLVQLQEAAIPSSWVDRLSRFSPEFLLSILLTLFMMLLVKHGTSVRQIQWVVAALSCALGGRYLLWRWTYTWNTQTPLATGISAVLFAAEAYGFVSVFLFYLQVMNPVKRVSPPPPADAKLPAVDIFVTIFNESLDVLYRTLVGCMAMDYPKDRFKVYVLDDGQREDVRRIVEKLGCHYITRENSQNAKAGNLNNGFAKTSGEFVLVLDCDHIPVRSFLRETIGFFKDPQTALVQTPHYFYNPDTFQRNLRLERNVVNEQDLFFYVIEPGRDRYNSAFFAGSGGIFRRSALESIGGFQVRTLTEDLHTSMVLHSRGHRSIYLNKILSAGLAPESYQSYLKQRQRWTRGGVQLFVLDNPLIKKGLSVMQKVQYFASIFYFFHGWPRIVYLTAPLAFLLLGIAPLNADIMTLMTYLTPYFIAALLASVLICREFRSPFWSDIYETVMCFSISRTAIETLFSPERIKFEVTPKGLCFEQARVDWSHVMPHLLIMALLAAGLIMGLSRLSFESVTFGATSWSVLWTAYNSIVLAAAIIVARERPQMRSAHRLLRRIPCELIFGAKIVSVATSDLSETGASLVLKNPALLPLGLTIRLRSDFGEVTELEAEIIRNDYREGQGGNVGVRFLNVNEAQRQSIIRQIYSSAVSWDRVSRPVTPVLTAFFRMAAAPVRAIMVFKENVMRRISPRVRLQLPCEMQVDGSTLRGLTQDLSATGLSLKVLAEDSIPDQVTLRLRPPGRDALAIRSQVVRRLNGAGREIILGLRFLEKKDIELASMVQV